MSTAIPVRVALVNGSFEQPQVTDHEILPDASQPQAPKHVPGWRTTASDHKIELWRDGYRGVEAKEGKQFAELNANEVSTLYQDLPTTPGTKLYWRLWHRGRLGSDTMALDIGAPGAEAPQQQFTDDRAWRHYTGTYTVPPGQTLTRFAFRSVSAAGGNRGIGNFLDGVFFGTAPLVELTKSATPPGPLRVGDVITYRITARNTGGAEVETLTLLDSIPPGTTYVPGSLCVTDGPDAGARTDQTGDEQAYFDAGRNRVVFHLGNGATSGQGGNLPNTDTLPNGTTVEYRVTVDQTGAGTTVANVATATYENRLGPQPELLVATSNEVTTRIRPSADLSVTKAADATTVTVGQVVTYRVTVRNTGPNQATGVTVTDQLPTGLTFLSATATAGTYDEASGLWSVGDLPGNTTATLTLQAKAIQTGPVTNTATATAVEEDPDAGDNTDSVTVCVERPSSCNPGGPQPPCGCTPCRPAPCPPPCSPVDIVGDSGFEWSAAPTEWWDSRSGGTNIGPWNVLNGGVNLYGPGFVTTVEGGQAIELNDVSPGGVEQTLVTTPGQKYTVTYLLSGFPGYQPGEGGPAVKTGEVRINGQVAENFTFDVTGKSRTNMGWASRQFTFVADSPSTTLSFISTTPGNYGPVIDDVQVRADCSTIPCPPVPIDPAPCNALTRTSQGLLVPRTDYTGLTGTRPPAIGTERSVDIDVHTDGDCPRNVTIGARLTPWAGEVGFPGTVDIDINDRPLEQWFDVPGTDLTLPEVGRYAIDLNGRARIVADLPHRSNVRLRVFDVTAGTVVPEPDTLLWTVGISLTGPGLGRNEFALDNSAHLSMLYTIDGPRTLRIQARRRLFLDDGLTRPTQTQIVGYTGIRAIKIND